MKEGRLRKDSAYIYQLLPVLISLILVLCIILMSGRFMMVIKKRDEINQVARSYLLKMESTGYLQAEDQVTLVENLENIGVSGIDLSGTTSNSVTYGERIYLHIKGSYSYKIIELVPFREKEHNTVEMPFQIELMSTAKH